MADTVRIERPDAGHLRLVLDRPERRNALGAAELAALDRAVASIAAESPRVVSIVARGPAFGVGGDVAEIGDALAGGTLDAWLRDGLGRFHRAISTLRSIDAAVVAGVQGAAAGGTLGLVWAADHVVVADDLVLDLAYARLGASPDGGTSWFLPRLVGPLRAFELLSLSPRLDAARAVELGLANRAVPRDDLGAAVDAVAGAWLDVPPESLRQVKRLLREAPVRPLDAHLSAEVEGFVAAGRQPGLAERVARFLARGRAPPGGRPR